MVLINTTNCIEHTSDISTINNDIRNRLLQHDKRRYRITYWQRQNAVTPQIIIKSRKRKGSSQDGTKQREITPRTKTRSRMTERKFINDAFKSDNKTTSVFTNQQTKKSINYENRPCVKDRGIITLPQYEVDMRDQKVVELRVCHATGRQCHKNLSLGTSTDIQKPRSTIIGRPRCL